MQARPGNRTRDLLHRSLERFPWSVDTTEHVDRNQAN